MLRVVKECWNDFLDLVFPRFCLGCANSLVKGEPLICTSCSVHLPYTAFHESPTDNPLSRKFWGKVDIEHSLAYLIFQPQGRVQRLMHHLKYKGIKEIGTLLGQWYGAVLKDNGLHLHYDTIIPVPLHPSRLTQRGYNQAEVFAEGLSNTMEVPCVTNAVIRNTNTTTQTKKGRLDRWQNVSSIFSVSNPELLKGKHVLLVDDVITTGATLEACAQTLLDAGCAKVSVAAIAAAEK
jgi:ComF family protein